MIKISTFAGIAVTACVCMLPSQAVSAGEATSAEQSGPCGSVADMLWSGIYSHSADGDDAQEIYVWHAGRENAHQGHVLHFANLEGWHDNDGC